MGVEAVIATQVIDTTTVGRSLMTAADAAAARTAIGLGTLATQSGTFSGTSIGTNTGDQDLSSYLTSASAASMYQVILVSGTNLKTINGTSLLGSGDIAISASPAGSSGEVQYNNAGAFGGMTAVVYAGSGTHVTITSQSAAAVPLLVKGAASQSGNLSEWRNSSNTILARVTSGGAVVTVDTITAGYGNFSVPVFVCGDTSAGFGTEGSSLYGRVSSTTVWVCTTVAFRVGAAQIIGWASSGSASNAAADTGVSRNAAGLVEINSGTAGTFRDLIVRNLRMSAPTLVPASASATGSEGQIAWDADYIYVCTATNTWKRVAIATW